MIQFGFDLQQLKFEIGIEPPLKADNPLVVTKRLELIK